MTFEVTLNRMKYLRIHTGLYQIRFIDEFARKIFFNSRKDGFFFEICIVEELTFLKTRLSSTSSLINLLNLG